MKRLMLICITTFCASACVDGKPPEVPEVQALGAMTCAEVLANTSENATCEVVKVARKACQIALVADAVSKQ
jgi:hypothetical protein